MKRKMHEETQTERQREKDRESNYIKQYKPIFFICLCIEK